jgi:hypothetical protein
MSDINTDELIYPMMPKGKLVYETKVVAKKAEPKQQQSQKPKREVPNRICYANTAFKDWKPGDKIPTCHVCEGTLFPEENHKCSGFKPKFIEHAIASLTKLYCFGGLRNSIMLLIAASISARFGP